MRLFAFITILSFTTTTYSARILAVVPTPSYSHQIVFRPLWKELSLRGHQVVLLTANPMNNSELTNLTEIDLSEIYTPFEAIYTQKVMKESQTKPLRSLNKELEALLIVENLTLQNSHVQKLINNETVHFDVVLVEMIYRSPLAFSKRFNCPLIGIFSTDANAYLHNVMGNPTHPVLQPEVFVPSDNIEMSFKNRIISCFASLLLRIVVVLKSVYDSEKMMIENSFPDNVTSDVHELMKEISMLFINVNPAFWGMRPVNPNTIMFGGDIHIEEPKPLPTDLQNFLDSNSEGVIYFSLGSNIKSNMLDDSFKQIVVETIKSLPYKVLWKYESDSMGNKPENVKISKWIPQQDVLRHPNIKLFITQGGLQSIEEAIHNSVPMVAIPFFADQRANSYRIQSRGLGLSLKHESLRKDEFRSAILEVINNEKYRKAVEEISKLTNDQPMTGLEKLVWWTEYVIRNKGAKHFKNVGANLPLYKYLLLDVIGFFTFLFITILIFVILIFKQIRKIIYHKTLKKKVD